MSQDQKIYELEEREKQFLSAALAKARTWLDDPDDLLKLEALDKLYTDCLPDIRNGSTDRAEAIDVLGTAYGNLLVQNGFRWIVVEDQYGTDYAVRHDATGVMAFPHSSVAKRLDTER